MENPVTDISKHEGDGGRKVSHDPTQVERLSQQSDDYTEENLSLLAALRKYWKVSAYCLGLTSGALLLGYDLGIIAAVATLEQFREAFGEPIGGIFLIPALWLGVWGAAYSVGNILGGMSVAVIQDLFGRRLSIGTAVLLTSASIGTCYASDLPNTTVARCGLLLFGKLFQGFAVSMSILSITTYMSEVMPPTLRAPILALMPLFTGVGQLLSGGIMRAVNEIPGPAAYRTAFASQWAFSFLPIVLAYFIPESPAWLLRMGRTEDACLAYQRLSSNLQPGEVPEGFQQLAQAVRNEELEANHKSVSYMDCFRGTDRRRTIISVASGHLQIPWGMILLYGVSYLLIIMGMEVSTALTFVIVGAVLGVISCAFSFWTLTWFDRRPLVIGTLAGAGLLWLSIGIAGCFPSAKATWYVAIASMVILFVVGLGVYPAMYAITVETSSLRLRSRTQGMTSLTTNITLAAFGYGLPYAYSPDAGNLGAKTGFIFAGLSIVTSALLWQYLPETKDRTYLELDKMFQLRLPARSFKSWKPESWSNDGREV